jgi:hypothetical protein
MMLTATNNRRRRDWIDGCGAISKDKQKHGWSGLWIEASQPIRVPSNATGVCREPVEGRVVRNGDGEPVDQERVSSAAHDWGI